MQRPRWRNVVVCARVVGEVVRILGRDVGERMAGSIAAALAAVQRGASIVRVHDVRETVDALRVWRAIDREEV